MARKSWEIDSIVAGIMVDAALFTIAAVGAVVFVITGSMPALVGGMWMGNIWAREVGNRPGKARW